MNWVNLLLFVALTLPACKTKITSGMSREVFEGSLTYLVYNENAASHSKKTASVPTDTLRISIHGNCYLIETCNTVHKKVLLYRGDENRLYSMYSSGEDVYCTLFDASIDEQFAQTGKATQVHSVDSTFVKNNRTCRKLLIYTENNRLSYYYSPGFLPANPEAFEEHFMAALSTCLMKSNCWPVAVENTDSTGQTSYYELIQTNFLTLPEQIFIPPVLIPADELQPPGIGTKQLYKVIKHK
ncbi:MAG: hypothetical protein K1X77_09555 [Bacteroidia bacterium]|nr:hypothetical protein [Bacteroidia bacterium]